MFLTYTLKNNQVSRDIDYSSYPTYCNMAPAELSALH